MELKNIYLAIFATLMLVSLSACEKQGPAEEMGEKIDEAAEKVSDSVDEAGSDIEQAVK